MKFPLHHLMRAPLQPAEQPPLLLLLHGVGSNAYDLFGLTPYLDERLLLLSLQAPQAMGPNNFGWYQVEFLPEGDMKIDPAQAERSQELVVEFIQQALDFYRADPQQVYLMGFSQGCIISVSLLLTQPELLAGVVGMSGRILPQLEARMAAPARLAGKPLLWTHGLSDNVLPVSYGRAARDLLVGLPVELSYKEYQMGHEVSGESLQDVMAWLKAQLDKG